MPTNPHNTPHRIITAGRFSSIEEIKAANAKAGRYWFSTATLAFFRSNVGTNLYGECVFVSSEKQGDSPRRYSVRIATADGDIETLGAFAQYDTLGEAVAVAKVAGAAIQQGLPLFLQDGVMVER
jgi:hypothetical protein